MLRITDVGCGPPSAMNGREPAMITHVRLDGTDYDEGSAAHLEKIAEMHKAEILKNSLVHLQDIADRNELEGRTRLKSEGAAQGLRKRTAKLANAKLARANAAVQQCEARLRAVVSSVRDYALFMLDPHGNVTSWNAEAERIKGYTSREILGKHFSVFYESEDVKNGLPRRLLAQAAESGRAEDEGRRVRKDGSTFWANVVLAPVHSHGVLLGFAKVTHDLTHQRHLEDQLHQAQKMEAIGSLAGGLAHDFNNLMSVVISYSELLAMDLKEGDSMRADLGEIKDAGLRAVELTRQLLAFSRQQVLQPRLVDLTEIVRGMERMLKRLIGEDVELTATCAPELGKALVDPGQMEQVIMNLVVNARDAMPDGGELTIETEEVALDAAFASEHLGVKPGPHIKLEVRDNGTGMDEATQARIFEPFFTTKEPGKGTGLGLATVFGVVKQSGGTICVHSELGQGTTFTVLLPCADRGTLAPVSVRPPSNQTLHGSETILLVEDDERVRQLAHTILRKHGYDVMQARSGGDALILCEQHPAPIHLLLTDMVMPRMSGPQLAERLLALRPDMKVLYMSGYTNDQALRDGIAHSRLAFIQKPITPEALGRKIRQTLGAPGRT
jgi:two-component system, cell cycle sensor histidine kinase and response regulator CckA